jgi:hypothetical protein
MLKMAKTHSKEIIEISQEEMSEELMTKSVKMTFISSSPFILFYES